MCKPKQFVKHEHAFATIEICRNQARIYAEMSADGAL